MFGIVYFTEDASVSVISKKSSQIMSKDKLLWKSNERLEMKWDGLVYSGTIIRVGDDREELKSIADVIASDILRKLEKVPDTIPEEIFKISLPSDGKRLRKPTDRMLESKLQVEEEDNDGEGPKKASKRTDPGGEKRTITEVGTDEENSKTKQKKGEDAPKKLPTSPKKPEESIRKTKKNNKNEGSTKTVKTKAAKTPTVTDQTPGQKKNEKKKTEEQATLQQESMILEVLGSSNIQSQFRSLSPLKESEKFEEPATTSTPMTETWGLIQSLQDQEITDNHHGQPSELGNQPVHSSTRCAICSLPDPPEEFCQLLKSILAITSQDSSTRVFIETFLNLNSSQHKNHSEELHTVTMRNEFADISYTRHLNSNSDLMSHEQHEENEDVQIECAMHQDSDPVFSQDRSKDQWVIPSSYLTPKKQRISSYIAAESTMHMNVMNTDKTTLRRSPRKHPSCDNKNADQVIKESYQSQQPEAKKAKQSKPLTQKIEMVPLMENGTVLVDKTLLNKATKSCFGHKSPGYALCLKLMPLLFTNQEMASSRGQGISTISKDDTRSALNEEKMNTIKDYIASWCLKYSISQPTSKDVNKAVTEAIAYARKKVKKVLQ